MINDDFYLRFEDEFRGPRSVIKQRVSAYLPIIEPLKAIYPNGVIVDLGCGRGEWIELLQENGWRVQGIDTNISMVEMCQSLGLPALKADAIEHLRSLEENSVSVVSGFHIAEHLPFELLLELVREAHRTLLPGGMLILETPNPENDIVRASSFYLDPTHRNPLPPDLMQFVAKDCGFLKSVIMRLNGPEAPGNNEPISRYVLWALSANPDYGLVAQKRPDPHMEIFYALDRSNSEQVDGLTILNNSIVRFENEMDAVKSELTQKTNEMEAALNAKEVELDNRRAERDRLQAELDEVQADLDNVRIERDRLRGELGDVQTDRERIRTQLDEVWAHRERVLAELDQVYHSRSFRITAPLRAVMNTARVWRDGLIHPRNRPASAPAFGSKVKEKKNLRRAANFLRKIPWVAIMVDRFKRRFPRLWMNVSNWINGTNRVKPEQIPPVSLDRPISEDEQYFLDLFKREIEKRKNS